MFTKVNEFQYLINNPEQLIQQAKSYIDLISSNKTHEYIMDCNDILLLDIIARLVSVEFFKTFKIEPDILSVLIEFTYNNISYYVSLSQLPDPNEPENIKYVESIYIK